MMSLISEAGLANRMRALDSASMLAIATGHSLSVWWPRNQNCGAAFGDLFAPIPTVATDSPKALLIDRIVRLPFKGLALEGKLKARFYDPSNRPLDSALEEVRSQTFVAIRTEHPFFYPESFAWATPKAEIASAIASTTAMLGSNSVGVHIRRGDHVTATRDNPTEAFVSAMQRRVSEHPETVFFVASDDPILKAQLRESFRAVTHEASNSRSDVKGVRAAVVDLFALANCSEIWGSRGSSFGEVAHHLRKAPLIFPIARTT